MSPWVIWSSTHWRLELTTDLANTGGDKLPENLGATLMTNVDKVPAAFYNKTGKDGIAWSKKNPQAMISSLNQTVRHLRWQLAKTDETITDLANKINAFGFQLPSKGSNERIPSPVPPQTRRVYPRSIGPR